MSSSVRSVREHVRAPSCVGAPLQAVVMCRQQRSPSSIGPVYDNSVVVLPEQPGVGFRRGPRGNERARRGLRLYRYRSVPSLELVQMG